MTCECGGEIYQFDSGHPKVSGNFPGACRRCGAVWINGERVNLGPAMEKAMASAADEAASNGKMAEYALTHLPEERIDAWFQKVYHTGYTHGFFRALAYFQHHAKEGRLIRLRKLWEDGIQASSTIPPNGERRGHLMYLPAYTEFCQLLAMGVKDAEGTENTDKTGEDG
jgi:hypothetical protein